MADRWAFPTINVDRLKSFLGSSSSETRSTNQDAACEQLTQNDRMHGPVRAEMPGGESGVPADPREIDYLASFMDANSELWKHERWFESYPMDTPAERVAGLGAACSYWHSCWEAAIQERDEWESAAEEAGSYVNTLRAALGIAAKDKAAAIDTRRAARKALKKGDD